MLKLLKKFTKTEWTLSFAALLFIILQVWMDLTIPDYMSEITTLVQTEGSAMSEILAAGGKMLGCALGSFAAFGMLYGAVYLLTARVYYRIVSQ